MSSSYFYEWHFGTENVSGLSRNTRVVRDIRISKGICLLIQRYFCAAYHYVGKGDLSKGYQNQKENKNKIGMKMPYILCILNLF